MSSFINVILLFYTWFLCNLFNLFYMFVIDSYNLNYTTTLGVQSWKEITPVVGGHYKILNTTVLEDRTVYILAYQNPRPLHCNLCSVFKTKDQFNSHRDSWVCWQDTGWMTVVRFLAAARFFPSPYCPEQFCSQLGLIPSGYRGSSCPRNVLPEVEAGRFI
jgi:hypothetical protein